MFSDRIDSPVMNTRVKNPGGDVAAYFIKSPFDPGRQYICLLFTIFCLLARG
jgi:hypothetical protein